MRNKDAIENARSAIFVPGIRPERFHKARSSGADLAILDLEDSVLPVDKPQALLNILNYEVTDEKEGLSPFIVRLNSNSKKTEIDSILGSQLTLNQSFLGFMLPKVEAANDFVDISDAYVQVGIVESVRGIRNIYEIAESPRVTKLAFGGMDFAAEVESSSAIVAEFARIQIILASAGARISKPWDSPSGDIANLEAVTRETRYANELGFGGKLAIHPHQVEIINQEFAVSKEEIEWAEKVLAATAGAVQVDGQMVDRPIQLRAERILKRAQSQN